MLRDLASAIMKPRLSRAVSGLMFEALMSLVPCISTTALQAPGRPHLSSSTPGSRPTAAMVFSPPIPRLITWSPAPSQVSIQSSRRRVWPHFSRVAEVSWEQPPLQSKMTGQMLDRT